VLCLAGGEQGSVYTRQAFIETSSPAAPRTREVHEYSLPVLEYTTSTRVLTSCTRVMQLYHMKQRLLYNQRSRPLVVRRENAALTHEA